MRLRPEDRHAVDDLLNHDCFRTERTLHPLDLVKSTPVPLSPSPSLSPSSSPPAVYPASTNANTTNATSVTATSNRLLQDDGGVKTPATPHTTPGKKRLLSPATYEQLFDDGFVDDY